MLKLVIEPVALLLEDERSEASSEEHNQTTLLFIDVIYKYTQLCKEVYLEKSMLGLLTPKFNLLYIKKFMKKKHNVA